MLVALDVDHRKEASIAGAVLFRAFEDEAPEAELRVEVAPGAPYVPGSFHLRELPALIEILRSVHAPIEAIVVDGYVWLGDESRPGLGAHLHRALGSGAPVIGVAKKPYRGARLAVPLQRGRSERPLFVSAVGMDVQEAARRIRGMHGEHRIPTLLRRVDRLCREGESAARLTTGASAVGEARRSRGGTKPRAAP